MDQTIVAQYSLIAAAFIAGLASIAAAFSDSKAASHALEGMTRQPEMAGKLFTNMLVGVAGSFIGNPALPTPQAEAQAFLACAKTPDFSEGVAAFLAKRPAQFAG